MALVTFTENLQRHFAARPAEVPGATVRQALESVFEAHPQARSYVLDDQGRLRKHVVIFVDGRLIGDRQRQSDEIAADSELLIMQALSGG